MDDTLVGQRFLDGGGDMGALIRAFDWASHPLGAPASWPQSLKTAVSICLGSPLPMLVGWGRELFLVYNDAYRLLLGTIGARALGQPAREFCPQIWHAITPEGDAMSLTAGAATTIDELRLIDRAGSVEECYFTFAYSSIRDERGSVAGVCCTAIETTERVVGERRLRLLNDLAFETANVGNATDVCTRAAAVLSSAPRDIPFALIYLFDDTGSGRLFARTDSAAAVAAPARVMRADEAMLADIFHPSVVVPIAAPGQPQGSGLLVAGLNPQRPLDGAYRSFLMLVAGHIASGLTEARTLESEAKFSIAFDNTPLALTITSLDDGRLVAVNEGFLRFTGYTRDQVIGRSPDELGLWVDPAQRVERFARLRAGQPVADIEARFRTTTGDELIGVIGSAVIEIGGRPCVLSSVTDITERKRAEEALREGHAWLRAAMDAGRLGAWEWDVGRNKVTWTERIYEFHGMKPGTFDGTLEAFATLVHGDDLPLVQRALERTLQSRAPYELEFRTVRPDGEVRWLLTRAEVFTDAAGNPRRLIGITQDVTARKQTEAQQAAAREAAESANRLKDQFLATLSHELRTPLNAILGYARMLRTRAIAGEKRERALEVIERNARAQNQLVEDLLDISRIGTGKIRLDMQPVPAAAPLREAIESIKPAAEAKEIILEADVDPFAGTVSADATRLQQVFWNLLSNAVKFTQRGGHVSVRLEREDGWLRTVVSDSGIGIAPDFLPYVFDPFRQADGRFAREHGGLGLGLAICRQLVDLHGGSIGVASGGPGRGATFTVRLPLRRPAAIADEQYAGSEAALVATAAAGAGERRTRSLHGVDILLVDDEADTLELFRDALETAGATVRAVSSARAALQAFDLRTPHLFVTDLGLPGMDGYRLLREIRGREEGTGRTVPAVAVTAYARMDDRRKAMDAGFQAHLAKPVDQDTLVDELIRVLDFAAR